MRFAAGAILLLAAAMPSTADAFAVSPSHQRHQHMSSSSTHTKSYFNQRSSSSSNNENNILTIHYNSLRDLLGTPDDENYELSTNNHSTDDELSFDTSNADNFNNMLHPQRRNFQGRPSRDSGRLSNDNDELGLNTDRLQPFSFSGQTAKENTRVKKQGSSPIAKSVIVDTEAPLYNNNDDGTTTTVRANDFNNMIGIAYSKKSTSFTSNRNPITQQNSSKDVDRETGMHRDKISTFSFSSKNTKSAFLEGAVSGSNGGSSLREATWAKKLSSSGSGGGESGEEEFTIGGESKEERQKRMESEVIALAGGATATNESASITDTELAAAAVPPPAADPAMNVDNFHNMINVDMSKNTGLKRLIAPKPDGQVNHSDRMATFSLLSMEDENDGSDNLAPETLEVNHGDRMGTFSFASSTSSSGATKKPKLQQIAAAASAAVPKNEESRSKPAPIPDNFSPPNNDKVTTTPPPKEEPLDTRFQVYSAPQKCSLSSLASSLATKSRADRIKEIQIKTDPKLLHPDGMNVPRLNAKGDVMSMSSTTGGMNVFERIEADLANQKDEDDVFDDDDDIVAENKDLDEDYDEIVENEEEEEEDDKEESDTVGEM